jgi:hypothetical protein
MSETASVSREDFTAHRYMQIITTTPASLLKIGKIHLKNRDCKDVNWTELAQGKVQ